MKKFIFKVSLVIGIIILFLGASISITPDIVIKRVKADNPDATFEWKGWWINSKKITVSQTGNSVTAKIRINNEPSGLY